MHLHTRPDGYAVPFAASPCVLESSTKGPPMSGGKSTQVWDFESFGALARATYPAATVHYLSRETGIPERTVEKHLRGEAKPQADHCLAYLSAGHFGQRLAAQYGLGTCDEGRRKIPASV